MNKKKSRAIMISAYAAVILFTVIMILATGRNYTVYISNPYEGSTTEIECSDEDVIECTESGTENGITKFRFRALKPGKAEFKVWVTSDENELNRTGVFFDCTVLPSGVIYIEGYDFGGHQFLLAGIFLLTLITFIMTFRQFFYRKKSLFFSYKTVLDLGLAIFSGLMSIMYFGLITGYFLLPGRIDSWQVFNYAGIITSFIFIISIPLVIIFAGFLSVSNISLIRHEGFRRNNLFGLLISAVLAGGSAICIIMLIAFPNSTSNSAGDVLGAVLRASISSAFIYFECLLFSTQFCTQYAARHEPKYNQDFIMILGCKVKNDGTPTPLLRGRIDRAVEFYKKQTTSGEKTPCFIPSGGKGSDEVISEGECMKNYLIENGIDESIIFPETESTTTLENMKFSKKIADEHKKSANILFSTTNYHIFRSGILSAKAGLRADGIGAKTKWYFWPNAQMREFIGLLASEWAMNLVFIILTVSFSTLIANLPSIVRFFAR